jgi:membrane protease YdiL (CAAX protease family)
MEPILDKSKDAGWQAARALIVVCAYMLVRNRVYHCLPAISLEQWFWRDALMSIARLAALIALLVLNRKWHSLDWRLADYRRAIIMGIIPVALWEFYFTGSDGSRFPAPMICGGMFSTALVGLFEEYAFRGPLLAALRQKMSLLSSILLSSAFFVIYHVQAQPPSTWGAIFLMGVIFANLRVRGLSIGWLAVIHGVIDASFFLFKTDNPAQFSFYGIVLNVGLLAYAVMTFPSLQYTIRRCCGKSIFP